MEQKSTGLIILAIAFVFFYQNTNAQSVQDSSYHWQWNATQGWVPKDKMFYTYDANNKQLTSKRIIFNTVNWVNDWQYQNTYDSALHLTVQLLFDWAFSTWQNDRETHFTFDSLGNQVMQLRLDWISSSWHNDYKWFYSYDANHNLLNETQQDWVGDSVWVNTTQNTFTYDAGNNRTSQLIQTWFSGNWVNNNYYLYTYDPNDNQLRREANAWVVDHWDLASQYLYSYDGNGNQISRLYQTFPGTLWVNSNFYYYTYDSNNNQSSWLRQNWDGGVWGYVFQYLYTHDAANNKISEVRTNWSIDEFINADSTHYYYSTVIGMDDLKAAAGKVLVYPSPAANQIRIQNAEFRMESIEIFDVLGQRHNYAFNIPNSELTIDVSSLASGIYFVKVKGDQKERVAKFVKE